jgi:LmbE family N-acetylglucosaminyl deacetylase
MKKVLLASAWILASTPFFSQQNQPLNSAEILLNLKKLNTVASVLYIAAHPDDENTRLLAYLANERNFRTGYLSLTRGDGGQNLIGKEQGELLGVIRTQELLAARKTDGAEQFFTRAYDFGFSKTPEETFSFWNKDSILSDVVLTIRRFKPDVIICRFPTTGEGGHGHHTASAILAVEAFEAAADPKRFPEQLVEVQSWQAKRILWNTFNFGTTNTTSPNQLKIDVGGFNPLLGKSYGEIAADSRSNHKSQGFGTARQRGSTIEYFKHLKGDSAKTDLFDGIVTGWSRFNGMDKIGKLIDACIGKFNPLVPENSISGLVTVYKALQTFTTKEAYLTHWKEIKLKETENLLLACSGLWLEAVASEYSGIAGEDINISVNIVNRLNSEIRVKNISYLNGDTTLSLTLNPNELYTFKRKDKLPKSLAFSNPYWLNQKHELGLFHVSERALIGKPENASETTVSFNIQILDLNLKIERELVYKFTDPVKGEIYRPFEILPPATVHIPEKAFIFTDITTKTILLTVKANTAQVNGRLELNGSEGWDFHVLNPDFSLTEKGEETVITIKISAKGQAKDGQFNVLLKVNGANYQKSIKRIEYDHIPYQFILTDAQAGLVNMELKKAGNRIGYIPGAGDEIPAALKQIGYDVTILTDDLLSKGELSGFNAIVTGIRAYNTSERLPAHYHTLMDYVKNGGNLIVQYNTNSRVGPVKTKIGPYPFTISRDRVTNESAEVKFKNEKHQVLNYPNTISSKDFEGWVQERGIYFATDVDSHYETILTMNDPNEKANEGSLIIGTYGRGNFVYTGLAFFRQLPAGVPGAYRLFVNLLSLPENK